MCPRLGLDAGYMRHPRLLNYSLFRSYWKMIVVKRALGQLSVPSFGPPVGIVIGLAAFLAGCEYRSRSGSSLPSDSVQTQRPSQVTWDATYSVNEDGRRRAQIRAARMDQYRTEDSTYSMWRTLSDTGRVRSYIFEDGDSSATILADSVVYYAQEGRFEAYGNVFVRTHENRQLESEHLTWHQFDRTIRTRRFVHITTPSEDVRGNGLVADEDLETYQIGEFTAEVEVEE